MSETSTVVRPLMLALMALGVPCHRIHCGKVKGSHPNGCKCSSCAAQREAREKLEATGALYVFARSVEDGLRGLGLVR